jgi:hypothetical protein
MAVGEGSLKAKGRFLRAVLLKLKLETETDFTAQ